MTIYVRPPTRSTGEAMRYNERRAKRRAADAERPKQVNESPTRDSLYGVPYHERRAIRRAEQQGRREGEQLAVITEQAKRQAELDALPEHERRPPNHWRQLIEVRRPDAWRRDVGRRLKVYEREARMEDERIDALMEQRKKQHEMEMRT